MKCSAKAEVSTCHLITVDHDGFHSRHVYNTAPLGSDFHQDMV